MLDWKQLLQSIRFEGSATDWKAYEFHRKLVKPAGERNMREIGAFEAKNTLGSLLDRVSQGEEIVITRHGRPVARLVPESGHVDREKARRAAADIIAAGEGVTLSGISLRELIDEGRH